MKRFYFIAAMAIMAAGCQKTEIQNEVQTPIGFSTEVGKQTKAIVTPVDNETQAVHPINQPFAVYAYGYQLKKNDDGSLSSERVANSTSNPMKNVEIVYKEGAWKADVSQGAYYWPNDPTTRLDFYAYSPYIDSPDLTTDKAPSVDDVDKVMTVTSLSHSEAGGLVFAGYTHSTESMYVDFMEATPVRGATYNHADGNPNGTETTGTVPMTFNHKMTQIVFNVTTDNPYPGITFTIQSITLNGVANTGAYSNGTWTATGSDDFLIFPADSDNGAVLVNPSSSSNSTVEDVVALKYEANATTVLDGMKTTGVTMIPQDLQASTQKFTIVYEVKGKGVATETVTKTVDMYKDGAPANIWASNKKITYKVMIGLKEIKFEPVVANWDSQTGNEYTFQQ